jgi:Tfp pilus assembly protein PilF
VVNPAPAVEHLRASWKNPLNASMKSGQLLPTVQKLLQDALAACKHRDHAMGIQLLTRASKMAPREYRILMDIGFCHGLLQDYALATEYFEKGIRLSGWQTEAFVRAGIQSAAFYKYDQARRYLERALKQNGGAVEALVALAEIEERHNQLEAAIELADRALRLDGNHAEALLVRGRLHRLQGQNEASEKIFRSLVTRNTPETQTVVKGWYELGKILDGQSRFDEAMAAFCAAKGLLKPHAGPEIAAGQAARERIAHTEKNLTAEVLQSWLEHVPALAPTRRLAVLCGHPRSGTTLLEQVLDSHPEIVSAEETDIFKNEALIPIYRRNPQTGLVQPLKSATDESLRLARTNYFHRVERFLGEPVGDRLLLDKNPSLTPSIPEILRFFPETKFLVALRDPRDVCLSCFMQSLEIGPVAASYLTLEGTVAEYVTHMGLWLSIKPRIPGRFIEIRYEDMVENLEPVARRTLEFLGVPWDARVLGFDRHAQKKVVHSPTYTDVKKPIYRGAVGRWRNYQKYLKPYLEKLEPFVRAFGYE